MHAQACLRWSKYTTAVQATSCACERTFNISVNQITSQRNLLATENVGVHKRKSAKNCNPNWKFCDQSPQEPTGWQGWGWVGVGV